jgi:hypothetical protein
MLGLSPSEVGVDTRIMSSPAGFHLVAIYFNLDVSVGRAVVADTEQEPGVLIASGSVASKLRCTEAARHDWSCAIDLDGDSDSLGQ